MLEKWLLDKLNQRKENREHIQRRAHELNLIAQQKYNIPAVIADVISELGLKPHQGYPRHAAGEISITYEVQSEGQLTGFGKRRKPLFISSVVECQDGEFFDTPSDPYTSHRVKRYGVLSLELTEDGEFSMKSPYQRSVRLGTTAVIREHEDLSAAVKDQLKRKKPIV